MTDLTVGVSTYALSFGVSEFQVMWFPREDLGSSTSFILFYVFILCMLLGLAKRSLQQLAERLGHKISLYSGVAPPQRILIKSELHFIVAVDRNSNQK